MLSPFREGDKNMLGHATTLVLTLAAITTVVLALESDTAPAAPKTGGAGKTITCKPGKVCQGTPYDDVIYGSDGKDNIRPDAGNDKVYAGDGDDAVGHSYGIDHIEGGPGADTVRGGFDDDTIYGNRPGSPDTDEPDGAHDLVDCAWLASRGDTGDKDVGYGEQTDTVVDCSNRDDQ
jgi:Ca2+-binding RTX toxin-like protein